MTATPAPPAGAPAGLLALLDRLGMLVENVERTAAEARAFAGRTCDEGFSAREYERLCNSARLAERRFAAACDASSILALLTAARRGAEEAEDAACWRALLACERVRVLWTANLGAPDQHLSIEFWERFPNAKEAGNAGSRDALTLFASTAAYRAAPQDSPHHTGG